MIVFAIISYALPNMTGRKFLDTGMGRLAFWTSNIGMIGMMVSFGVAGVVQVYMERILKIESVEGAGDYFMTAQAETVVHFWILIIMASLFAFGIFLYIWEFIKHGRPNDEAVITDDYDEFA